MSARPSIVLVHGAWSDGSSWSAVIERLQADGYRVTAPQLPLTALADDVARLHQVLALREGPTVVAGHSYGGQIVTALGTDAPNISGLVYIAAFGLDQGESLGELRAPAWKSEPSWYVVAADDQAIPPTAEREFASRMGATTVEIPSSHLAMVAHPGDMARLVKTAAEAVLATSQTASPAHGNTVPPI